MAYSKDLREKVLAHYNKTDDSVRTTAQIFGISTATLQSWRNLEKKGEELQYKTSPGRPTKLNQQQKQRLIELSQEFPDWTQQRFADLLTEELGISINQQLISDTLQRLGITYKKTVEGR